MEVILTLSTNNFCPERPGPTGPTLTRQTWHSFGQHLNGSVNPCIFPAARNSLQSWRPASPRCEIADRGGPCC